MTGFRNKSNDIPMCIFKQAHAVPGGNRQTHLGDLDEVREDFGAYFQSAAVQDFADDPEAGLE